MIPRKSFQQNLVFHRNFPLLVLTVVFCLASFVERAATAANAGDQETVPVGYEWEFPLMGTSVYFQAFAADDSKIIPCFREARKEMERLVDVFSDYDDDSEVLRISQHPAGTVVAVSTDLWIVLQAADRWHRLSNGAFDASVGPVTRLWRQARKKKSVPDIAEIQQTLESTGWRHLQLFTKEQSIGLNRNGMKLDLGAIAKGYIVDRGFQVLHDRGFPCCMVNAGGDLRVGDAPPGRTGWRVEVAALRDGDPGMRQIMLVNAAIATSGDLWQYSVIHGQRRSHILDPRTGMGVLGPMSGSVIAQTAMDADAGATTVCVLGHEKGIELAEQMENMDALIVSMDDQKQTRLSITSAFDR